MQRTIVIGDVHGCIDELHDLLDLCKFKEGKDRLIFTGDLVDRGPDPVGVVDYAMCTGAESVLGNHEEKHIRYAKWERVKAETGKKNPMQFTEKRIEEHNELSELHLDYLRSLPVTISFKDWEKRDWIVVHAGFESAGVPPEEQAVGCVIRVRLLDAKGKQTGRPGVHPPGAKRWPLLWCRSENVIYGHNVFSMEQACTDSHDNKTWCYGIDTGCVFGGNLTALVFEEQGTWPYMCSVKARKEYAVSKY